MTYFIKQGNTFKISSTGALDIQEVLPPANYIIKQDAYGNLYFEIVDDFQELSKYYGNTLKHAERILKTFGDRSNSTGVMLNGEKGSGKTLLAKKLSIEAAKAGIPTIIINSPWCGDAFNKLMQDISQPCVILFDEFEKVYAREQQEAILTLLDGVFPSKKLFIITCNDKWRVDEHMRNRPGRIFYMIDFIGLSAEFITEYCQDNLINKSFIDKVVLVSQLFRSFNFDMLKALVEDMNRYDEDPLTSMEILNAKPEYEGSSHSTLKVQLFIDNSLEEYKNLYTTSYHGNPLNSKEVVIECYEQKTSTNEESELFDVTFYPALHVVKVDIGAGVYEFNDGEGNRLILTRPPAAAFDYKTLLL